MTIPTAIQLYSVRDDCARDFAGVLKQVAAMGYDGVEFAGYHNLDARELRAILDGEGLRVAGTHTGLPTLLGDALPATIEFNIELGNRFLIVPGLSEDRRHSIDAWKKTAALFNTLADQVRPHGMVVGYHNHMHEFQPMNGEIPWDAFFSTTQSDVVMQLDTGNAMHGGADPVSLLKRYPGRAMTVHLKEYARDNDKALVGEGEVAWSAVFDQCERDGTTEWYIVEQESYPFAPLECAAKCLENLRALRA